MAEQQKVTDDLTLIEIDIENAIMNNDFDRRAPRSRTLVEKSPDHPRREFLQTSIDRAAELQKLAGQPPSQAQVLTPPAVRRAQAPPRDPSPRNARRSDAHHAHAGTVAARPPDRPVAATLADGSVADASRAPMARPSAKRRARRASRSTRPSIRRARRPMRRTDNSSRVAPWKPATRPGRTRRRVDRRR